MSADELVRAAAGRLRQAGRSSEGIEALLRQVTLELFRGPRHPLRQGAQVKLQGMTVTVLEDNGKGPTRLGFTFDKPLEDPSFVFLRWKDGALRPFTPPPVGERVAL